MASATATSSTLPPVADGTLDLQEYQPGWVQIFEDAKQAIITQLGTRSITVQHIGSTAVPQMLAKPIIDILLITPELRRLDDAAGEMTELGYRAYGEYGIPGRRYFTRSELAHSAINLHAFEPGHRHAVNLLLLRDYLRSNDAARRRYSNIKRALVSEHPTNPGAYQAGKQPIIEWLLARATGRR